MSRGRPVSTAILAFVVFLATLANATLWSARIPYDGAPDEADHAFMVQYVAEHGTLPQYGAQPFAVYLMDSTTHERFVTPERSLELAGQGHRFEERPTYIFTRQLPYLVLGWMVRLLGGASFGRARLAQHLVFALTAALVTALGALLWPQRPGLVLAGALSFSGWPQVAFVGAYVNDDMFAVFAAVVALLGVCLVDREGPGFLATAALALGLGLVLSSKLYDSALLPLLAIWAWRTARRRPRFLVQAGLAAAGGLAFALPWMLRNVHLFGDAFGTRFLVQRLTELTATLPPEVRARTSLLYAPAAERMVSMPDLFRRGWFGTIFISFWACFGWMSQQLEWWMYVLGYGAWLGTLFFALRRIGANRAAFASGLFPVLFAVPFFLLLFTLALANTFFQDYQPQGRYLLPCVPPLVLYVYDCAERAGPRFGRVAWLLAGMFALENAFGIGTL